MTHTEGERKELQRRPVEARFPEWGQKLYPGTVARLRRLPQRDGRFWVFARRILEDAECAKEWKAADAAGIPDPNEAKRRRDRDYHASLPAQFNAARRIAAHLERHEFWRGEAALSAALLDAAVSLGWTPPDRMKDPDWFTTFPLGRWPWPARDVFVRTLKAYADRLERMWREREFGPWHHRFQVGPLLFQKPIDRQSARTALASGLLFGTTFWARWLTSPKVFVVTAGMPMPTKIGDPLWPVAAELLGEALEEHVAEKEARERLNKLISRNPKVGWYGWPMPPEPFFPPTLEERFPRQE